MRISCPYAILWLLVNWLLYANSHTNGDLYDHLFANYNKHVRPIEYTGQLTTVWVSPNLYSIIDVVSQPLRLSDFTLSLKLYAYPKTFSVPFTLSLKLFSHPLPIP